MMKTSSSSVKTLEITVEYSVRRKVLQKEFGEERVFDTPLAESGIGGLAVGLAS